jgi:hypothetical protein
MRNNPSHLYTAILILTPIACSPSDSDDAVEWREVSEPLPSGVLISVEVSTPANDAILPQGPVQVTGFATLGESDVVPQTTLAYVIDASGSTASLNGCGGNLNSDFLYSSVLDCEIAALLSVHNMAIATGTIVDVGAAVFGSSAATADMQPAGTKNDLLTAPDANLDKDWVLDVEEVVRSVQIGALDKFTAHQVGKSTSYGAALAAIEPVLSASEQPNKVVVFVSDGLNNTGPSIYSVLPLPPGTVIHTFAIGMASACDVVAPLGSLQDIADETGGSCTHVPRLADLPNVIPSVIAAELTDLRLTVDDVVVPVDSISPAPPKNGPVALNYSTTLFGLAPGSHELCATAEGHDAVGGEDVTECVMISINQPPATACRDVSVVADAQCSADVGIDDGSADPDGDDIECEVEPAGPYSLGRTDATLTCTDSHGFESQCEAKIEIVDETPPTLGAVDTLASLWPPNHSYHDFSITDCVADLIDNCDDDQVLLAALEIVNVTSDEPNLAPGSGNTCDDIDITSPTTFRVRAERTGGGNGRVYTANFRAIDAAGNLTPASCQIVVPPNMGSDAMSVDDGCALCVGYDCGGCPPNAAQCN